MSSSDYLYANLGSALIHYTGPAGRQFRINLPSILDRVNRKAFLTYGLSHSISLALTRNLRPVEALSLTLGLSLQTDID